MMTVFHRSSAFAQDVSNTTVSQHLARLHADLTVIREDQRKLYALIEETRRQTDVLARQVADLSQRLVTAEGRPVGDPQLVARLKAVEEALRQETGAREKAVADVISSVSKEISAVSSRVQTVAAANQSSQRNQGEYVVVRGDTLGAIAQAFGVSVTSLKEINSLKDDVIREGQKLLIPAR